MEAERFYAPPRAKYIGKWIDILLCANCGQVRNVLTKWELNEKGDNSFECHSGGWQGSCPACGKAPRTETNVDTYGCTNRTYSHVMCGTGRFISMSVWWNPFTWGTGYWQLHPLTQNKIKPLSPIEMLAAVEAEREKGA